VNPLSILSGNLQTFTFSLVLGLGVGVGISWSVLPLMSLPDVARGRLNNASITLLGALIGGRAGYILLNWAYYQRHLWEAFQIWLGGFTWISALAGAFIFILIATQIQKTSLGYVLDGLLPLFSSIAISTWLACWLTGYAYGIEINRWWGIPAMDESGLIAQRWPIQLLSALSALGFHWLAEYCQTHRWISHPGLASSLVLAGFSLTIFCLTPFRGDTIPMLKGIRLDIWASAGFFALSLLMAITFYILPVLSKHYSQLAKKHED
jgi:phosphatidylglycerol:prolipoprotein diacylglycerol transferase